jgi:hypothetical protein
MQQAELEASDRVVRSECNGTVQVCRGVLNEPNLCVLAAQQEASFGRSIGTGSRLL